MRYRKSISQSIFELATSFRRNVRRFRRDYPAQEEETKGTPSGLFVKYNFYIDNEQANTSLRSICQFFKVPVRLASNYSRLAYHKQSCPCSNNKEQESYKKYIIISLRWPSISIDIIFQSYNDDRRKIIKWQVRKT